MTSVPVRFHPGERFGNDVLVDTLSGVLADLGTELLGRFGR